jgi:hypothetical protein
MNRLIPLYTPLSFGWTISLNINWVMSIISWKPAVPPKNGAGLVQSYSSLADLQAKINDSAKSLSMDPKRVKVWAPFTRRNQ